MGPRKFSFEVFDHSPVGFVVGFVCLILNSFLRLCFQVCGRGRHRKVPIIDSDSCIINSRMAGGDKSWYMHLISMHRYGLVTRKLFETVHAWIGIGFDSQPPRTLQGLPKLQRKL